MPRGSLVSQGDGGRPGPCCSQERVGVMGKGDLPLCFSVATDCRTPTRSLQCDGRQFLKQRDKEVGRSL